MNCSVVKDLMSEYIEGLCSDETVNEIEAHLEKCEECRKYYEDIKKEIKLDKEKPSDKDEIKPFKKVKKSLRLRAFFAVLLGLILGCIAVFVFMLSVDTRALLGTDSLSEYIRVTTQTKHYEKLAQNVGESIMNGDFSVVMDGIVATYSNSASLIGGTDSAFYTSVLGEINKEYENALKGKVKSVEVRNCSRSFASSDIYQPGDQEEYDVYLSLILEDSRADVTISYISDTDYLMSIVTDDNEALSTISAYLEYYKNVLSGTTCFENLANRFLVADREDKESLYSFFFKHFFSEELIEAIKSIDRISETESFMLTRYGYDEEKNLVKSLLNWKVRGENGSEYIVNKEFWYTCEGYVPVDDKTSVLSNGKTDQKLEKLLGEF